MTTATVAFAPGVAASLREESLDEELYMHSLDAKCTEGTRLVCGVRRAACDVNGHSSSPGGCQRIC